MALTQISTGMLASGDGTVDLNIDNGTFVVDVSTSRVGIGAAPTDGTLHVQTASAGTVAASTQADDIVIENNAEGGMTIITPDDQSARIRFTSPSTNNDVGGAHIFYRQNINKMNIGTTVSGGKMAILSGAGNETMLLDGSGNVGIGTSLYPQKFNVLGTHENAGFYRDYSGSGVGATYLQIGRKDSNGDLVSGVRISGGGDDGVAASHNGYFEIATRKAGTFVSLLSSYSGGSELVVNDNSVDMDFRVESDNNTHALFVEGSTGNVGVGVTPPAWASAYSSVNVGTAASFWGTKTGASLVVMSDNTYFDGSTYKARNTGAGSKYFQNAGAHYWDTAASVSAGAAQSSVVGMKLDTSGMLTVPYQPSDYRKVQSSVSGINANGSYKRIYFGNTQYAVNSMHSAYGGNTANGSKFTAPVAGVYFFSCMLRIDGFGGNYCYLDMRVNDTTRARHLDSETGSYLNRTVTGVYKLAVGDYITFEFVASGDDVVTMDSDTYASVHLLG